AARRGRARRRAPRSCARAAAGSPDPATAARRTRPRRSWRARPASSPARRGGGPSGRNAASSVGPPIDATARGVVGLAAMTAEPTTLPPPHDRDAVERGLAQWQEETGAAALPTHRPLLEAVFGNSPYLAG